MPRQPKTQYTLVQHSAAGNNPEEFGRAVELRSITPGQAQMIRTAGGLVFDSYTEADAEEDAVNYPPGVEGLIPQADGSFSKAKKLLLDGSPIYLPVKAPGTHQVTR
ncbi:hypothetical protein ACIQC7_35070 [Kitasatospora sp. NPDC088556]|uniref:hypothetical protein n=1 Tax=Kitasatospora sp. NPDC088556 TaxID=3364076 RepID=UPI0037F51D2A